VYRDFDDLDGFIKEIQQYHSADEAEAAAAASAQLELIPKDTLPPKPRARRGRRPSITQPKDAETADSSDEVPLIPRI